MNQGMNTPGPFDKSRVLDVKPLRCLVPTFPNPSNMPAFPSGFSPFYPFHSPNFQNNPVEETNNGIPAPVPINSFRAPMPPTTANGDTNKSKRGSRDETIFEEEYSDFQNQSDPHFEGEDSGKRGKRGNSSRTRSGRDRNVSPHDADIEAMVTNFLISSIFSSTNGSEQADGDKDSVRFVAMTYDLLRRKISQIEDAKGTRPDLRAGTILMSKGVRTNAKKRVGAVPGIEVGDIYFFRFEMCLVGLHSQSMGGIDYMTLKSGQDEDPLALSIVSSGSYENKDEDGDVLIYSGQGGVSGKNKNATDQKLERGNLALETSLQRSNEVRVIRGVKDVAYPTGKVYIYDGLYKIQESWIEKGKSGCIVFKYKLFRVPGQAQAFTMWKSIQQWRENIDSRPGLISPDITSGSETLPVCLVNEIDYDRGFSNFTYIPSLKYSNPIISQRPSMSCPCRGGCQTGDLNCHCLQKNGGNHPYTSLGVLMSYKSIIYECGPSCLCPPNCKNRVSQAGIRLRLEVFKTKDKGWGLRSWDPIRSGAFICEYAGEVIPKDNGDDYIFDATRIYESLKFMPGYSTDAPKVPFPLVIDAKKSGNVSRFMNHSCMPNVYWQPVLRESDNESYLHIAFFAVCHVAPMEELTFDYGTVQPGKTEHWKKKCLCKSGKCRGHY